MKSCQASSNCSRLCTVGVNTNMEFIWISMMMMKIQVRLLLMYVMRTINDAKHPLCMAEIFSTSRSHELIVDYIVILPQLED
mmetsp:Transcript_25705/g.39835  ORF Transcript_25705/g.39835 Transcript_25705/m.39835 type:complete len:82 (-) Transcript_25705:119-364(-)